ncbi:hypothetical protein Ocin01_16523 [Orchesella cincta]|uniref:Uncharacterized protein n=1 Tax=Orchesella cincta TaxID=48709 RepID=A0A1D2MB56_ORCCI|nr:hypothetical protein Ocin01_16523 [Orchesella cincta]
MALKFPKVSTIAVFCFYTMCSLILDNFFAIYYQYGYGRYRPEYWCIEESDEVKDEDFPSKLKTCDTEIGLLEAYTISFAHLLPYF